MKLEEQVVSLKLAKELKGEGYPQDDSYFIWRRPLEPYRTLMDIDYDLIEYNANTWSDLKLRELAEYWCATPTVAELGEKLKRCDNQMPVWDNYSKKWLRTYRNYKIREDTEANARAKMWLYLKKEGLIK